MAMNFTRKVRTAVGCFSLVMGLGLQQGAWAQSPSKPAPGPHVGDNANGAGPNNGAGPADLTGKAPMVNYDQAAGMFLDDIAAIKARSARADKCLAAIPPFVETTAGQYEHTEKNYHQKVSVGEKISATSTNTKTSVTGELRDPRTIHNVIAKTVQARLAELTTWVGAHNVYDVLAACSAGVGEAADILVDNPMLPYLKDMRSTKGASTMKQPECFSSRGLPTLFDTKQLEPYIDKLRRACAEFADKKSINRIDGRLRGASEQLRKSNLTSSEKMLALRAALLKK